MAAFQSIATWNVNSLKIRLEQVLGWLHNTQCEVLCLQETKLSDDQFPLAEIENAGYSVVFSGQKTYNGVAIISQHPITQVVTDVPGLDDPQRRIMAATIGEGASAIRVINLYVVNGKAVGEDKYHHKLRWLEKVTQYVKQQMQEYERVIVLGDFNIAPKDEDVHNPMAWQDKILCSKPERDALQSLLDLGLTDVFREFKQPENSFSWWDYRSGGFEKNQGLRIDLILTSTPITQACQQCIIDTAPRQLERPSDHAPVIARFGD